MQYKRRRTFLILFLALTISALGIYNDNSDVLKTDLSNQQIKNTVTSVPDNSTKATDALGKLSVKGRAPKTGYDRTVFMNG